MKKFLVKLHKWTCRYEWLLLILGGVILARIPSLFEPHHYGDEEIYFVMGRGWREGVPFYRGIFDHKPPLIYILAGVARSVFWLRFFLLVWMVVYTWLFWLLAEWFWSGFKGLSKRRQGILSNASTALFALFSSSPALEGQIANGELFMMMPVVGALVFLGRQKGLTVKKFFVAGLIAGVGLLFKIPMVFDVMAFGLFWFFFRKRGLREAGAALLDSKLWAMVGGFLTPFLIVSAYYFLRGMGADYLRGVLLINLGYTSSYATSSYKFNPLSSGLFMRGMILASFTLMLYVLRKRMREGVVWASLWLGFALFGALLSARPYPHYLQQVVPAAALLLPSVVVMDNWREWLAVGWLAVSGVMAGKKIRFWYYPTVSYYQNFWDTVRGRKSREAYLSYFDNFQRNKRVADYLRERMGKEDEVFVWGTDPTIYNLLDKLPAGGRYIVSFHVRDFKAYGETMAALVNKKPKYVVILPEPIEFEDLWGWLEAKYLKVREIEGVQIYQRVEP